METFSALLVALRAANSPVTGEFPSQRASNAGFDVFFGVRLIIHWPLGDFNDILDEQFSC